MKEIIAIIVAAAIIYYSRAQQQAGNAPAKHSEKTTRQAATAIFAVFLFAFAIDLYRQKIDFFVSTAGTAITLAGTITYTRVLKQMGKNFSTNVEIRHGQKLITNGAFAIVRHPAYVCSFFIYFGIALAANSLACLAILLFLLVPWYAWRIKIEEAALEKEFGKEWQSYKKRVPAIIPKIF